MSDPLVILFEDPHLLAVAKPAGVLTQGRPGGEPTLEAAVRRHLDPDGAGGVYLGTVHRLDRPVSGVVALGQDAEGRPPPGRAVRRPRGPEALLGDRRGTPLGPRGDLGGLALPSRPRGWGSSRSAAAWPRAPDGPSRGSGRPRPRRLPPGAAWLRLWPETGRTHQLRAQAASRGLPILGDRAYGSTGRSPAGSRCTPAR